MATKMRIAAAYQNYKQLKQELQNVLDGIESQHLISFA
jgi:hypothetical protein